MNQRAVAGLARGGTGVFTANLRSMAATRSLNRDNCSLISSMPGRKLRFLFASIALALNAQEFSIPAHYAKHEYHVAMRDGVHLFTAVYTPKDMSQKYPILLTRTPYGVEPYGADKFPRHLGPSPKFAEDKFIFVYQDVRGRFMSEGKW